ncbi:hypothetical protein L1987_04095 [Smallanthus sonchifolius]|uniref:Uncharacterized protein n=1 Tax=Smallanthus sonchifolius TaxID=185202 RepID=A0ACB9KCJ9_9ASTR|nr:hypothetical protein L1987_04095 [Smallanthus sonchifolius]
MPEKMNSQKQEEEGRRRWCNGNNEAEFSAGARWCFIGSEIGRGFGDTIVMNQSHLPAIHQHQRKGSNAHHVNLHMLDLINLSSICVLADLRSSTSNFALSSQQRLRLMNLHM